MVANGAVVYDERPEPSEAWLPSAALDVITLFECPKGRDDQLHPVRLRGLPVPARPRKR